MPEPPPPRHGFGRDQACDQSAREIAASVAGDIHLAGVGRLQDSLLLHLQDSLILPEGQRRLLKNEIGYAVGQDIGAHGPEIVGGGLGLGRDAVEAHHGEPLVPATLVGAGSCVAPSGMDAQHHGHELDLLPAIDTALEAASRHIGRGRGRVRHATLDEDASLGGPGLHLGPEMGVWIAADGVWMDIGQVRQVHQVVDQQLPVAVDLVVSAAPGPGGVVVKGVARYRARIGLVDIAHPDPDEGVLLLYWIAANAGLGRDAVLAGDAYAQPRRIILHAVIGAPDGLAGDFTR